MSEHRSARNGGEHPRIPKGGSAADHETAQRKKVTEDNSVLRKQAEDNRETQAAQSSTRPHESTRYGTTGEGSDYTRGTTATSGDPGRGASSDYAGGTGAKAEYGTTGTVGSDSDYTGSTGSTASTGPRVAHRSEADRDRSETYSSPGYQGTAERGDPSGFSHRSGRDDSGRYDRVAGEATGRDRYSDVERESGWRDRDPSDIGVGHGVRADRGDGAALSVTTLLRTLAGDAGTLARKELALARSEITAAVSDVKTGIISTATGGAVLYAGLLFLLLAATFGLATVMQAWLAALIVGAVVTIIGGILLMTGKKKMQAENFRPDRTAESLRKDREMIDRRT
jgi:hypothetical protein